MTNGLNKDICEPINLSILDFKLRFMGTRRFNYCSINLSILDFKYVGVGNATMRGYVYKSIHIGF